MSEASTFSCLPRPLSQGKGPGERSLTLQFSPDLTFPNPPLVLRTILLLTLFPLTVLSAQEAFTEVSPAANLPTRAGAESVSVTDYNNDGWEDIYVAYTTGPNELWRNEGNGTFTETALIAGITGTTIDPGLRTKTAVWGDFDNNGAADLYLGNLSGPDQFFRNNGDGTFTDATTLAGLGQEGHPLSVNLADTDRDGWLDIYVTNFLMENILYHNNGDGTFTDVTQSAGVTDTEESMGSLFFDYDLDGDADLYLVHDNYAPNILYRNDGDGSFTDVSNGSGANTESFGMGVDAADLNNDGWPDLYVTNLFYNYLLLNNGDGTFSEYSNFAGTGDNGMGWGTTLLDFNDDGNPDLYVCNDFGFSPYPNVLYRNNGDGTFTSQTTSITANTGKSYGTATLDFDHDGRLDLVVANRGAEEHWQLFRNTGENGSGEEGSSGNNETLNGNRIILQMEGTTSNRQAVGTTVRLSDDLGRLHTDEVHAGHGWASQNSGNLHFGLGDAEEIVSGTITWPSGLVQELEVLPANGFYFLREGQPAIKAYDFLTGTTATEPPALTRLPTPFRVFPNPADNRIWLETTTGVQLLEIEITDASGRTLISVAPAEFDEHILIELGSLRSTGPLFLKVLTREGWNCQRIIRKQ